MEMKITQTDNGWILEFVGHDGLEKQIVTTRWSRVVKEIDEYFGWNDANDDLQKKPPYDEDNE